MLDLDAQMHMLWTFVLHGGAAGRQPCSCTGACRVPGRIQADHGMVLDRSGDCYCCCKRAQLACTYHQSRSGGCEQARARRRC